MTKRSSSTAGSTHSSIGPPAFFYAQSDLISGDRLREFLVQRNAQMREPFDSRCTALILDGFLASSFTKKRIVEFVRAYKKQRRAGNSTL
jgi:hypothetical protein